MRTFSDYIFIFAGGVLIAYALIQLKELIAVFRRKKLWLIQMSCKKLPLPFENRESRYLYSRGFAVDKDGNKFKIIWCPMILPQENRLWNKYEVETEYGKLLGNEHFYKIENLNEYLSQNLPK